MKYLIYFILIIALAGFTLGVFSTLRLAGTTPNLLLLFVLFLADEASLEVFFIALLGGFYMDVTSGLPVGSFTLGLVIVVFLYQIIFGQIFFRHIQLKYLPVLVIVAEAVFFFWLWLFYTGATALHWLQALPPGLGLWHEFIPNLIYTLLLMYPMYWLTGQLKKIIRRLSSPRSNI